MRQSNPPPARPPDITAFALRPVLVLTGLGMVVALCIRMIVGLQSLWYDEAFTLLHYVVPPWHEAAGQYLPNNHLLHTLLVKVSTQLLGYGELAVRLPALLASLVIIPLLAGPRSRSAAPVPSVATLLLILVAALSPWATVAGSEARGYSLMVCLGILATSRLRQATTGPAPWYILGLAGAIATVPLALALVPGHILAMWWLGRQARPSGIPRVRPTWCALHLTLGVLLGAVLYLPVLQPLLAYARSSPAAAVSYGQFLANLAPHLLAGTAGPVSSWVAALWSILAAVLAVGLVGAWRYGPWAPDILAYSGALGMQILAPLLMPGLAEPRFACLAWPLLPLAVAGFACLPPPAARGRRHVGAVGLALLIALMIMQLRWIVRTPPQPLREGVRAAEELAGPQGLAVGVYMGAVEAASLYSDPPLPIAYSLQQLRECEEQLPAGRRVCLVVFYPHRLAEVDRELTAYIAAHYRHHSTLPGRVSDAVIWERLPPLP
jgi:hypothetical protein